MRSLSTSGMRDRLFCLHYKSMVGVTSTPDLFYKGRSQEKEPPLRLEISLLRSPTDQARCVLMFHACARLPGRFARQFGVPVPPVFIASLRRSRSVPKPTKPNRGQIGDHSSIRDFSPIAFSGYPRGPRVGCETTCPKRTLRLTNQLRRALEPECLENRTATARGDPGMERIRSKTLKLFVVSDDGRQSTLLSSIRSIQSWQSSTPGSA
jgi:hypothetical protein